MNRTNIFFEQNTLSHETKNLKTTDFSKKSKSQAVKTYKKSINYEIRPTKIIKYRFSETDIKKLLALKLYDLDEKQRWSHLFEQLKAYL